MEPLHVFFCTNEQYAVGALLGAVSMADNLDPEQKTIVHLLSQELSDSTVEIFRSTLANSGKPIECKYPPVDLPPLETIQTKQDQPNVRSFALECYTRLLIPSLFPDVDFGIYLDSDLLIQKDLSELTRYQEEDTPLFAIPDIDSESLDHPNDPIDCEIFNIRSEAPYFNSGVMIMNLKLWDSDQFLERCLEVSEKSYFKYADQSILNVLFADQWKALDDSWNRICLPEDWEYAFTKADITYHYGGVVKPWFFPPAFAIGSVRKVWHYLNQFPESMTKNCAFRKPFPLFFIKSQLQKMKRQK